MQTIPTLLALVLAGVLFTASPALWACGGSGMKSGKSGKSAASTAWGKSTTGKSLGQGGWQRQPSAKAGKHGQPLPAGYAQLFASQNGMGGCQPTGAGAPKAKTTTPPAKDLPTVTASAATDDGWAPTPRAVAATGNQAATGTTPAALPPALRGHGRASQMGETAIAAVRQVEKSLDSGEWGF